MYHVVSQKLTNVSEVLTASIITAMSKLHARKWVKCEKAGPMNEVWGRGEKWGQSNGTNGRVGQTTT
jgi:hypothetical protein